MTQPHKYSTAIVYLVMDLCTGGELFDRICELGCFYETNAAQVVRTVTDAVAYLHEHNIVHRDIKVSPLYIYLYTHSILGCRHQQ